MKRREFLGGAAALFVRPREAALEVGLGPQLFLDDYLLERTEGLAREMQHPERLPRPVLESSRFGTTQPYLTVLRDEARGRFRIWYNRGPAVWHAESADGIEWRDPRVAWDLPRSYGASLVDDGPGARDPEQRFKLANWQATRAREDQPGDDGGMYVGFSPDGFRWTAARPVLPTWPEDYPNIVRHGVGDIVDVFRDPLRGRYGAAVKLHALPEDGYAPAPKAGRVFRRLVGISWSEDFIRWERPRRVFVPDDRDEGLLEFYGMGGVHFRGGLAIGLVRVLRDDLACDPGGPVEGIGYSVLATSRDGVAWQRMRAPFLDRNPEPGSWDHAMSWIGGALPVGDEVRFYYGGYARGHKVAPERERQIGIARLRKDRYLALKAGHAPALLRTRLFRIPALERLTLNLRAPDGEVRARLLDERGMPHPGFDWADCRPVRGDDLAGEVHWKHAVSTLRGRPVRLELRFRQGGLFGVGLA